MDESIHADIKANLQDKVNKKSIPHMIFHGPSGSGKRTIVNWFIRLIYNGDRKLTSEYVMYADCAHGKGIKFVREQVKFFAKTNLRLSDNAPFKTIVLTNADKLTTDAQSALRRIIEVFSHSTRFFVVVEQKFKMLLPILSRLSDVYVPLPVISGTETNLNVMAIKAIRDDAGITEEVIRGNRTTTGKRIGSIVRKHCGSEITLKGIAKVANECYQLGLCGDDVVKYVECKVSAESKSRLLLSLEKMRVYYRSEPLFMMTALYNGLVRSSEDFVNVGFM